MTCAMSPLSRSVFLQQALRDRLIDPRVQLTHALHNTTCCTKTCSKRTTLSLLTRTRNVDRVNKTRDRDRYNETTRSRALVGAK